MDKGHGNVAGHGEQWFPGRNRAKKKKNGGHMGGKEPWREGGHDFEGHKKRFSSGVAPDRL